ncbi:DnaJ-domain-containing protein [Auriculariales sp. MPI-PUGE-AT-0066]|nr:DnaJ-domain-containing protein [Auriculariales sp. MPI-PUGE-AT-0066]
MESNKEEAIRCLDIARKHWDSGNLPSAHKFCTKSIALYDSKDAQQLLDRIVKARADASGSSEPSASTSSASGADAHPSAAGVKHRGAPTASSSASSKSETQREFTPAQAALVRRVRTCKVTEYYEILSLTKDCDEGDVKKAYKKLALQLHPDKNGAPGADEAFKLVSKAFQVLSDPDKRRMYDSNPAADPEQRSAGMSRGSHFHSAGGGFEGEISPEDLFNMFFGGGGGGGGGFGGGPFGGTPVFTASFGGPGGGFRTANFGGQRRPQQQQPRRPQTPAEQRWSQLMQLAPLLILFGLSLLQMIPSLFYDTPPPDPGFAFRPTRYFSEQRRTSALDIPYYVNSPEFQKHPIYQSIPEEARASDKAGASSATLYKFERGIERAHLTNTCNIRLEEQRQKIDALSGFMGFGADWVQIRKLQAMRIPECDDLRRSGWA